MCTSPTIANSVLQSIDSNVPLIGLACTQVHNVLGGGSLSFQNMSLYLECHFHDKPRQLLLFTFSGRKGSPAPRGPSAGIIDTQYTNTTHLRPFALNASFESFRVLHHQLAWLSFNPPDIISTSWISWQVTSDTVPLPQGRIFNTFVSHIHHFPNLRLLFISLHPPPCS